jgi:dolichyl-phosphate-mannose--protein O-mannosyl transferase
MSPVTPFLALAAAYVVKDLSDVTIVLRDPQTGTLIRSTKHPYRPLTWIYLALAVGLFGWFYPVLVGEPVSLTHWHLIVWFPGWI